MTNLEITLSVILYAFLAVTVYRKQKNVSDDTESAGLLAAFAPLTVLIYAIRAVFFEDWK